MLVPPSPPAPPAAPPAPSAPPAKKQKSVSKSEEEEDEEALRRAALEALGDPEEDQIESYPASPIKDEN